MSQNMLPFVWSEMGRYGASLTFLRLLLLRWYQSRSFRKANGVIFLTQYAQDAVIKKIGILAGRKTLIPHGISPRFAMTPRPQRAVADFSAADPYRILYVSIIDKYKHQWQVVEAVGHLRAEGIPVELELVGPPASGMSRLRKTLARVDPDGSFIKYRGEVPYEQLADCYWKADLSVFASSCESMSIVLLEGMAAGLPVAGSNKGPMPEILGEAGVYFDPEDSNDMARAIRALFESPDLRAQSAKIAFDRAQQYSWKRCADETLSFLAKIALCHGTNTK